VKFDKLDWILLITTIVLSIIFYAIFQGKIDIKILLLIIFVFGLSIGTFKKLIDKWKLKQ